MHSFATLAIVVAAAFATASTSSAAAVPALKRQTPASCSPYGRAALAVRPKGAGDNANAQWVGVVDGVQTGGIDGQRASVLVTKDDNGNALTPQIWEFAHCTDLDSRPPLDDGYTPPNGTSEVEFYGIVRPYGATQHCLALQTSEDETDGDRNGILDSNCVNVPEEYRTWFYHSFAASHAIMHLTFAGKQDTKSANEHLYVSPVKHGALKFLTNAKADNEQEMELVLTTPPTN